MNDMNRKELIEYYLGYFESERLFKDKAHTIEYFTTMHFLNKFLPKNCSVLDCCAGGGAYSFALAKEGYAVTAGDLIKAHVDAIKSKNDNNDIKNIYCGDVLNLPFEANKFDAVLCMGALYHLMNETERVKCISECLRVLKSNGILVLAYINRNAVFINHFRRNFPIVEWKYYAFFFDENKIV